MGVPVKFATFGNDVKLAPGQQLHFQTGKGYYAGPAVVAPRQSAPPLVSENGQWTPTRTTTTASTPPGRTPPFVPNRTPPPPPPGLDYPSGMGAATQAQIDAEAAREAQAGLTPQQQEVQRQQALATQQAAADEAAITGFQTAAGGIIAGVAPMVGAGYTQAAQEAGQLGAGVGGRIGADLSAEQQAGDAFAASQGQSGGHSVDPSSTGTTVNMLGGVIPGTSLAAQGAAAQAQAAESALLPVNAGREQLDARMAQARTDNDNYAQQLIKIAAQFPDLKAQAIQQLNAYEVSKANYREQVRTDNASIANQKKTTAIQARAEKANEAAAGINAKAALAVKVDESKYRWASLDFKTKQQAMKAQAAARSGKTIDVGASRLLGHVVYKDGSEDKSITVKQTTATTPQQKAQVNRAKATSSARVSAFKYATKILGKPTSVDKKVSAAARAMGKQVGTYIAASDQKYGVPGGVFPPAYAGAPATTNDPARAERAGGGASNYADAQQKTWAEIDGDGLMSRYGYSRQQVLAIVNSALARAGWRNR